MSPALRRELVSLCGKSGEREACGVLIGTLAQGCVTITRVAPTKNGAATADTFACDPGDVVALDIEAAALGLEIVGFWHSHLNGDARPSSSDARGAWPGALTAIVQSESSPSVRFWRFTGDAAIEARVVASASCAAALRDHNLRPRTST